LYTYHDASKSW
jgi:3oxo_ACP_reduc: 3-oxoacyl-[acyl-carrier-protein] reductase